MELPTSVANSTSKVKVEYTDPSGVFPLIASELQLRLPLRNLNWSSPGRPVRSIECLYVDLYPDEKTSAAQLPKRSTSLAGQGGQDRPLTPTSGEFRRQSEVTGPKRERRHQIPGLRRTPYLKIYILRCDDTEIYKTSVRKALREWIKANTPPSQSSGAANNQENHDAFEWMILHVVLPDLQNNAAWPYKTSTNVLDKIRSDFNSSSRGSADRIAQVPATKNLQVQGATVSGTPSGPGRETFLRESNRAWDDLVGKVKALILTSFDLRVRQYEEDIKEKGSQRNLPGWNFCTFFVLKEGLARGFESVGLVNDALVGYDELSAELSSALRKEAAGKFSTGENAGLFREHTQELLVQAEAALEGKEISSNRPSYRRLGNSVLDTHRKSYRELILSNNISAFDFQNYVFARQVSLLLRFASQLPQVGSAPSQRTENTHTRDTSILAEICQRGINFIADLARTIRGDLRASFKAESGASETALAARFTVTENLIASHAFQGAIQILAKTQDASLPVLLDPELQEDDEDEYDEDISSPSSPSSNPTGPVEDSIDMEHAHAVLHEIKPSRPSGTEFSYDKVSSSAANKGAIPSATMKLAAKRAELFLVARRALSTVAARRGWRTSWLGREEPGVADYEEMDEVALEDRDGTQAQTFERPETSAVISQLAGIVDETMRLSLSTESSFHQKYETLSLAAFNLFCLSDDKKCAHAITADIASLRLWLKDYSTAAAYFRELAPFYAQDDWGELATLVLDMYSFCLKKLGRTEEYVHVALQTLARLVHTERSESRLPVTETRENGRGAITCYEEVETLAQESTTLKVPIVVDMADYFSDIHVDPFVQHQEDEDSIALDITFKSCLSRAFRAQEVRVRLVSMEEGPSREIWLSSPEPISIHSGRCSVKVTCRVMTMEWYVFDKIMIEAQRIVFQYKYPHQDGLSVEEGDGQIPARIQPPRVLIWPSPRALTVKASVHSVIHLERPKSIYFEVWSGDNQITLARLTLKSASAGLRLHTAEAEAVLGDCQVIDAAQPGIICFRDLSPQSKIGIQIPYKLEAEMKEVTVRSEITYETAYGSFIRGEKHFLSTRLSLGVNVQDIFKEHTLFSKFAISTATGVPLQLLSCDLKDTGDFRVSTPHMDNKGLCVFAKQPASLVYRIIPHDKNNNQDKIQKKLSMHINYMCLDEKVITTVQNCLYANLKGSKFWGYSNLLLPHLAAALRGRLTHQELETIGLLREVELAPYSELNWTSVISAVPPVKREAISSWLQEWHCLYRLISIPDETSEELRTFTVPKRHIIIPVEIPRLQILHTASLSVKDSRLEAPFTVGDMISAELNIRHTRAWDQQPSTLSGPVSFYYELDAPSDTWLVAGQRRAMFTAKEDATRTFPITLLPLKAGKLMLPMLEILLAREDQKGPDGRPMGCEMDYESQGSSVEVVPGVTSVTLDIEEDASGGFKGGIRILEVERGKYGRELVGG